MNVLDTRGKVCPFPLIDAKVFIQTIKSGEELEILFDCTQAIETIPQWAAEEGHEIINFVALGDAEWKINLIKK